MYLLYPCTSCSTCLPVYLCLRVQEVNTCLTYNSRRRGTNCRRYRVQEVHTCYNLQQQLEETRNLTRQTLYLNYKRYTGARGTSQTDLQQLEDTYEDSLLCEIRVCGVRFLDLLQVITRIDLYLLYVPLVPVYLL